MSKYKVLLIDDEKDIRELFKMIIDKEGYQTITAPDGEQGLAVFEREKPDIVISDIRLPGINGLEVLKRIKKISPTAEVIMITGYSNYDIAIQSLREGARDYLEKPIPSRQLAVALGRCKEKIVAREQLEIKPTVLICEDETIPLGKLSRVLEKEGYQVFPAENGKAGLELFGRHKIDVALLDIKMPVLDGLLTLHELKKQSEDLEVVMMTGYGDETTAIQAMRDGAINYLKKPIDLDQMLLSIQRAMETLSLKRSMLYRKREQELFNEVLTRLSARQGIIIDLKHGKKQMINELGLKLINSLPFPICVFSREEQIVFVNQNLKKIFTYEPKQLDDKFMQSLSRIGIKKLNLEDLIKELNKLFDIKEDYLRVFNVGKYAFLLMVKVKVLFNSTVMNLVAIGFRGERSNTRSGA